MNKKISLQDLNKFFDAISSKQDLFIPVDGSEGSSFKKYDGSHKLSDKLNTNRSAKDFFFPQVENIAKFKVDNKNIQIHNPDMIDKDFVIFGVRACDVASFNILDRVYLSKPYIDQFYKNRREHGIIITLVCQHPEETCFCTCFDDVDATNPGGDIESCIVDDYIYFDAKTKRGHNLLDSISCIEDADYSDTNYAKDKTKTILDKLPIKDIKLKQIAKTTTLDNFNSKIWDEMSETCLGCGTCTYVCPTCQCFDVREFDTGHCVERFRCWDSCMYSDFTKMAAANSRPTQLQRFRQRFMHKLVYFPKENDGVYGCVGCGRCLRSCPISMNIVKVAKRLGDNHE